jgi:hypothetical protein
MMEEHLDVYEHDWELVHTVRLLPLLSGAACSCTYRIRQIPHGDGPAESCRNRLKHDDMNMSINTVLKNICRAGNATCMKRSMQDMNGP